MKAEQLERDINALTATRYKAMELIELIDNSRYRSVLYGYYINRDTWDQVSESMHIEPDCKAIFKIRAKAIQEIENKTGH